MTDATPDPPEPAGPAPDPTYAQRRVSYAEGSLDEGGLAPAPLEQFERWYADAVAADLPEPNAMVLATVDAAGAPSTRTVLLKQADARGFVFFTNYTSRKARQLEANPAVALTFPWHGMQRQVSVLGVAERVPPAETAAYFVQRPWASRIGAWVSHQSSVVDGPEVVQDRWRLLAARWPDHGRDDDVPVPDHWGGVVVRAHEVELWQGRPSRLHDRLVFVTRDGTPAPLDVAAPWRVERRQP